MQFIGIDLGSSSVKVSLLDGESGLCVVSSVSPATEMRISAPAAGWAEQEPGEWYDNMKEALGSILRHEGVDIRRIGGIGIAYQMHGLVAVDRDSLPVRPSIIWCDSRAVEIGREAERKLGSVYCSRNLLNSPSNFTASKLAWVSRNEPFLFEKIRHIMLPGDYLAMRLTGELNTTIPGLSEGIFWDFNEGKVSDRLLEIIGIPRSFIPGIVPTFSVQGRLTAEAAADLGLVTGIPVSYRAGDQPNNAFSLNALNPGEVAATAGTSGVIYSVTDLLAGDPDGRVNTFVHVNDTPAARRLGVLACINGAGILNSWVRRELSGNISYHEMNALAAGVKPGCDGLTIFPFGNGAERLLRNIETGASVEGLNLNLHTRSHLYRAVQEGIAFAFRYAIDILGELGIDASAIRAGNANMFLSPLFVGMLSSLSGAIVSIYDTDGSLGAARGAALGTGFYASSDEAFAGLGVVSETAPEQSEREIYNELYERWKEGLESKLNN